VIEDRERSTSTLTDDRLDVLIRRAAIAGPVRRPDDGVSLPVLTRILIAMGVLATAGFTIAVLRPVAPTAPAQRVAGAPSRSVEREQVASGSEASAVESEAVGPGSGSEPAPSDTRVLASAGPPARTSPVLLRFTPEESESLAGLFATPAPSQPGSGDVTREASQAAPHGSDRERLLSLGRVLRSAMVAHDTLDLMTPGEQVEACRVWATEPSLRPVAFERLARLALDPAVTDDVQQLARELAGDPTLRPWLTSYGFARAGRSPMQSKTGDQIQSKGGA
jgi:hypothetical protein